MDLLMTMFKPRSSMSPVKVGSDSGSPSKRKHESSPTRQYNGLQSQSGGKSSTKKAKVALNEEQGEPKFTFDEVKTMIDSLLTQKGRGPGVSSCAALRHANFHEVAVPGHSVKACRDLIEKLVNITRRVRTLPEVLTDIKENLNKRSYTEAIMRSTLHMQPPKKPPSAYLLYHKERYESLRDEMSQASEIAKIVSEEWKNMDDRQRQPYFKKHSELVKKYDRDYKKCGLMPEKKPKRARSAKALYAKSRIDELGDEQSLDAEDVARMKEQFKKEYDELDKESKSYWTKQYKLEQERYRIERNEYIAANPHLDHHIPDRIRPPRYAIKPPVAPMSALKYFLAKKIPDGLEGQEFEDTKQKLKEKFAKLSDKKQLKYIKKAIKDRERYDAEVEEFRQAHPDATVPKLKPNVSKDQWKLYETIIENKPTPPAPTAYLHFCGKALSDASSETGQVPTQRMQSASVAWSSLSDREKFNIEKEHVEVIKLFLKEMEEWMLEQDEKRRDQVRKDEPRCRPDYWRKRLARMERNLAKKAPRCA